MKYGLLLLFLFFLLIFFPLRLEERHDIARIMEDYPWVRFALQKKDPRELHYISQIEHLAEKDMTLGAEVAQITWLQDYLLKEEGEALDLLVRIADCDMEVARNVSHTFWFRENIMPEEVAFLRLFASMTETRPAVARNVSETKWFSLFIGREEGETLQMLEGMDQGIAQEISRKAWFSQGITEKEMEAMRQIDSFSRIDHGRTYELLDFFKPGLDLESLAAVNALVTQDPEFYEKYFFLYPFTSAHLHAAASLSFFRRVDPDFSDVLLNASPTTLDYLETIGKKDLLMAHLLYDNFKTDDTVMRFASIYMSYRDVEDEATFIESCLFVRSNPEFVYRDTHEPYRYDLLARTISSFPPKYVFWYKSLIFEAVRIYSARFYEWNDPAYGRIYGWSSDRILSGLEWDGFISLLSYLIEENEAGNLVTDIRLENKAYLSALLNIPYEYLVNYDGTIVESTGEEKGTHYVYAIVYNIKTLPERRRNLGNLVWEGRTKFNTPLTDYIFVNGEKKDVLYLLLNARNWDIAGRQEEKVCVHQTYKTIMDAIALGIAPTKMYWKSKETGHLYPAYLASPKILYAIERDGIHWNQPFLYKGYISPYDEAGYKSSLGRNIEYVSIYDHEAENFITIYSGIQKNYYTTFLLLLFSGVILALGWWFSKKK